MEHRTENLDIKTRINEEPPTVFWTVYHPRVFVDLLTDIVRVRDGRPSCLSLVSSFPSTTERVPVCRLDTVTPVDSGLRNHENTRVSTGG